MAQLIFGSSLYPQRKDQISQKKKKKNWKTSHLAMHKLINFYTFLTAFLYLIFHKICMNIKLVHYFLVMEYFK